MRLSGIATWTRSTIRPPRTTGIVSRRAASPVVSSTVSRVGAPCSAFVRASRESGSEGRSARERTRPSGSRSCISASANSGPRNPRTRGSRSGGSGEAGSAGGASRRTPATAKSEASRSLRRCQRRSEYAATLTVNEITTTTPVYQSVSRARIESGFIVRPRPSARSRRRGSCGTACAPAARRSCGEGSRHTRRRCCSRDRSRAPTRAGPASAA